MKELLARKKEIMALFKDVLEPKESIVISDWKKDGGKIIGCLYNYFPEEIITAAGFLPYRVNALNSQGTELAEPRFSQINCSLVRHFYNEAAKGAQDFLDGLVTVNNCDHLRRLFDNWQDQIDTGFFYFIPLPKKAGELQIEEFCKKISAFKSRFEEFFRISISDESLKTAIRVHNVTKNLQRQLYDFRAQGCSLISAADVMTIMIASHCFPRERFNTLLSELVNICQSYKFEADANAKKVMVIGGELDNSNILQLIEESGAFVITDSLGYGTRDCKKDIPLSNNPISDIANYYLSIKPCDPRFFGTTYERNQYVQDLLDSHNVDGIIGIRILQCDHWAFELLNMKKLSKRNSIPYLNLETEYIFSGVGQTKTRVQAFIESIGA
ncbi:2-hydroxyacyl-CoA dehydratase [Shewanella yunxiaonensis]|uniref:2-hydroxyacyl-CoA dehydratase n=1 Tax=Shewanella yunxiaonensis TaxID=2829809 RepID=A0ABX7YW41_9GAMM|nr:2-hydroxyacyl-CoA dehydratase family protein [Shewanella yunxiaonensis]QUN06988.1 2-hydroxyacyl-CoA dehydratase [Shewanella yunxiaonensis]